MFRTHTIHWGHELLKSMLVTFVILLLFFVLASVAAEDRQTDARPPGQLPANIDAWAQPMQDSSEFAPAAAFSSDDDPLASTMTAWQALQARRDGDLVSAIRAWREIQLPGENETWRLTSLAELQMVRGNLDDAEILAKDAIAIAPSNSVAHYLLGRIALVRIAETPPRIEFDRPAVIWVSYPQDHGKISRPNWESHAIQHFADALLHSPTTDLSHPIMGRTVVPPRPGDMAMPVVSPTIADLLDATNTSRYVAESHDYLGKLFMKRGFYAAAEEQFDAAARMDTWVVNDYLRLVQHFVDEQDQASADRVARKVGVCVFERMLAANHEIRGMLAEW